jgi:Icc-related predicted phosphoesterase
MKILALADLHDDFWSERKRDPFLNAGSTLSDLNGIILAGDIANKPKVRWKYAFARLREHFPGIPVWAFPGNHDFYDFHFDEEDRLERIANECGVTYAQKKILHLGSTRILCATLWTDLEIGPGRLDNEVFLPREMNDYRYIRVAAGGYRKLRPSDVIHRHRDHLTWMTQALAEPFDGRTIVITHHAPHPGALRGLSDQQVAGYASDLTPLLLGETAPALWLHGHCHAAESLIVGRTEVRPISLGYPFETKDADIAARLARAIIEV